MATKRLAYLVALLLCWGCAAAALAARPVRFAVIGDIPYRAEDEVGFPRLIAAINREPLAFVVHVGDFKSGAALCNNHVYQQRLDWFNQFTHPLIYTFGDNEWTDCHRFTAGGYDPLERLQLLRRWFASGTQSLGQRKLRLRRQGAVYPENVRWEIGRMVFATLHVVGSNNNLGRNARMDSEFHARDRANILWLEAAFRRAREIHAGGLVLFMQANLWPTAPAGQPSGYARFRQALYAQVQAATFPVLLAHGDSHHYRIDRPPAEPPGPRGRPWPSNLTRLEAFGTPELRWVTVVATPHSRASFSITAQPAPASTASR